MSIPEPISSWATTELLNACVSLLKETLSFKDSLDIVKQQNNLIICKLDVILKSPYQEAIHHLKAKNVEEASNCLIKAIIYNRYNIPARLLYVQVLCLKGLFDVAVDYYWDLYCDFTLLTTIFPKKLYNIFRWYLTISDITFDENLKIRFGYKEESKKYNAVTVCVSRYGFVSCWRKGRTILGIDSPLEGISIYDWSGCKLVELKGDNPEVISLSINNVIYYIDGKCYLYDFKNNSNEPINASPFINIKIDWKLFSYLTISRHDLQSKLSKFGFLFLQNL